MIGPESEALHPPTDAAFSESVTFAFADPERDVHGLARLGVGGGHASALAVLMRGREPVGALAEGGLEQPYGAGWDDFAVAGLRTTIQAPLEFWTIACEGEGFGFQLVFEAISAPGEAAAVPGTEGYEQLCRVRGTVRVGDETIEVDAPGQRGHGWGSADWAAIELTRTVSMWTGDDRLGGVALLAARPAGTRGHEDETVAAIVVEGGEPVPVEDPRLSTTYDGDGHTRRVGLELWVTEDDHPLRAAGEVVCGTSLDLGALRLDLAFVRWRAEGLTGIGRYEIIRRSAQRT